MRRESLFFAIIVLTAMFMMPSTPVAAAGDSVTILDPGLTDQVSVVSDDTTLIIKASDGLTVNGTSWAIVTDLDNGDHINVTLYDDGTAPDTNASDGDFYGLFKIVDDMNLSGSKTSDLIDVLDLAHGGRAEIVVNLDEDNSKGSAVVVADLNGPDIAIHISSDSFYGDSMLLAATVDDDNLNASSVLYAIDDGPFMPFPLKFPATVEYEETVNTSGLTEGEHRVKVKASDTLGNTNEVTSLPFNVDHTPPEMVDIKLDGAIISGQLTLTITFIDSSGNAPTGEVSYSLDAGPWIPFIEIGPGVFKADLSMTDGPHTLTIRSIDSVGNIGFRTYDFIVDNIPPSITKGKLEFDQYWDLVVPINVSDIHLNITTVRYRIENGTWTNVTGDGTTMLFNITIPDGDLTVGTHNLTIEALDLAGNKKEILIVIQIVYHPEACSSCKAVFLPDGTVNITWTAPSGSVTGFRIYHSTGPITDVKSMTDFERSNDANFNWADLPPGTHHFAIVAVFNDVEGIPCLFKVVVPGLDINDISMTTPNAVPPDPFEGDRIWANGTLTNKGPAPAMLTAELLVDGNVVDTKDVDLMGDSDEPLGLAWNSATAGPHHLQIKLYQRGATDSFVTYDVIPNPLAVKKRAIVDDPDFFEGLLKDTPAGPYVKKAGGGLQCCLILIVLLVILITIIYAVVASRRPKRGSEDDELARAMAERRSGTGGADAGAGASAYPSAPKKEYPRTPHTQVPQVERPPAVQVTAATRPVQATEVTRAMAEVPVKGPVYQPPPSVEPTPPPGEQPQVPQPTDAPVTAPTPVVSATTTPTPTPTVGVEQIQERIRQLRGQVNKASMEAVTAMSKVHSAATKADAERALGIILMAKTKADGALRELEGMADEVVAAGLTEDLEAARSSMNRNIQKIGENADKAVRAASERTG